jgi:ferric-dicitrate binding protein FerR (iron transport regulator)
MSLHQKIAIDITLLTRYLAGEATPEEAMAIDDWLTDATHMQEFECLQKTWQLIPGNNKWKAPQQETEWAALQSILPEEKKAGKIRRLIIRYAVAAIIAGVLLTAGLYSYFHINKANALEWRQAWVENNVDNVRKGTLPDGTETVVNRNSNLQYAADYNQQDRKVLLQGEGYFNVRADKERPFVVQAGGLKILVLGTSFNVKDDSTAGTIAVAVNTGKVKLYTEEKELIVTAGQTGIYAKKAGTLTISATVDANIFGYVTHDFSFQDMPLPEICRYLENTFNVKIILDNAQLSQCRMSAHFKDRSVNYIMDIIAATLNIEYTIKADTIHLNGNGCN